MNTSKKGGFGLLFIGILIGMIGGMALEIILVHYGWTLNPLDYFSRKGSGIPMEQTDSYVNTEQGSEQDLLLGNEVTPKNVPADTLEEAMTLETYLARNKGSLPDSLLETAFYEEYGGTQNVRVAKDVLLFFRVVKIENAPRRSYELDSVLLDDRPGNKAADQATVEFWVSPINYKGYQWDTRKLVLFGYENVQGLRIRYFEGNPYLILEEGIFLLEKTSGFKSLVPVESPELISKLRPE